MEPTEREDLQKLGLLDSEARIYLALLKIGASSAGKIAKETKLNRVSVYKSLGTLRERGMVSYVVKANRTEYDATNPLIIKELISAKEQELDKLKKKISSLQSLFNSTKKEVETRIYEGIKGAKAVWERILEECRKEDEWLILGAPKSAKILGGYFKGFNERRAKKNIKMRIVYNQNAEELISIRKKQMLTTVRVMPEEYITPASIEVVNEYALIVIYQPQIIVFSLKNKDIADSFRHYFNLLWELARTL